MEYLYEYNVFIKKWNIHVKTLNADISGVGEVLF